MNLFPIGTVALNDGTGTLGTFFEPNEKVNSSEIRNIQTLTMQNITINTYKKQEPFRKITYQYHNIFESEYNKIRKFSDTVEGGLNSFFVVDLGAGEYVGTVSSPYTISLDYTNCYSTVSSVGAYYAFAWNGVSFIIGSVESRSTESITLTRTNGTTSITRAYLYPIYEVYVNPGDFDNFSTTVFSYSITNSVVNTECGWLRDGTITFISKYPTR